jgi:hypothetical protein
MLNHHLDPEVVKKTSCDSQGALDIIVFQGGGDGRGYRSMCKIPRALALKDGKL